MVANKYSMKSKNGDFFLLLAILVTLVALGHSASYVRRGHRHCVTNSTSYDDFSQAKAACDKGDCLGLLDHKCERREFQLCQIGSAIETSDDGSCIRTIAHELRWNAFPSIGSSCLTVDNNVGVECVFPFSFRGITYNQCTTAGDADDRPWCSTKTDSVGVHVSGQGEWGHCNSACSTSQSSCLTIDNNVGVECVFPFSFRGTTYNQCTTFGDPDDRAWCSTKTDSVGVHVSGEGEWGHCNSACSSNQKPLDWDGPILIKNAWIKKTSTYCTETLDDYKGDWAPYTGHSWQDWSDSEYLNNQLNTVELFMDLGCRGKQFIPCRSNTTVQKSRDGSCIWTRPGSYLQNCQVTITEEGPIFDSNYAESNEDSELEFFDNEETPGCFSDCDCSCAAPFCSYFVKEDFEDNDFGEVLDEPGYCHSDPQGPRVIPYEDPNFEFGQNYECKWRNVEIEDLAEACTERTLGSPCTSDRDCDHCGFLKGCGKKGFNTPPLMCFKNDTITANVREKILQGQPNIDLGPFEDFDSFMDYARKGEDRTCNFQLDFLPTECGIGFVQPRASFGTGGTSTLAGVSPKKVKGRRCPRGFFWKRTRWGVRCARKKRQ